MSVCDHPNFPAFEGLMKADVAPPPPTAAQIVEALKKYSGKWHFKAPKGDKSVDWSVLWEVKVTIHGPYRELYVDPVEDWRNWPPEVLAKVAEVNTLFAMWKDGK